MEDGGRGKEGWKEGGARRMGGGGGVRQVAAAGQKVTVSLLG